MKLLRLVIVTLALMFAAFPTAAAAQGGTATTKKTVQGAQERLQALGYQPGSTDGVMGARTLAALKKFQTDHNLSVTGVLDRKTLDALNLTGVAVPASEPGPAKKIPGSAVAPKGVSGKTYVTSGGDRINFYSNGRARERNGNPDFLYPGQSLSFGPDGMPTGT